MARFGRGLICLTLTRERCEFLNLPPIVRRGGTVYSTGHSPPASAADRATPCNGREPPMPPSDLVHAATFPLRRWMAAC